MGNRSRVFSFISSFGGNRDEHRSPTPTSTQAPTAQTIRDSMRNDTPKDSYPRESSTPTHPPSQQEYGLDGESPQPRMQRERAPSRPMSMVQAYQPPLMDVSQDTLPELQPIFTFLNSHANKLYQEGYFLKLDDQNTHGKPNADRTWTECFAQLVGTVLSLWDAAELDSAGQDGEVLPKFINLTDASIKMIESLPTRADSEAPLQNVLSISTAGKNRYLLHFNSHHSLIQWTAGIRLAMFEHAGLQEAYTGALIAGKGKALNNINIIMERAKMPTADWARVRFGAGTPWRRCWCVITPPDEKEVQKLQKQLNKKKSAYDRSRPPVLKGDIKFYDSKKTKKVRPIATINDAYSAFAIYPQSKPLIDASTLVKVEGSITIHSNPPTTTEGFVFVMPEVHPAVTGFEMMLRWLFPVYDTFALYGRPGRLVPDTTDVRSLMFAMPKHRRYGYLEILDVSGLILEPGSSSWRESEWRKKMKELTNKRMTAIENGSRSNSRYSSRRSTRNSFGPSRSRIQFDDGASIRSSPSITWGQAAADVPGGLPGTDSAPAAAAGSAFSTPTKAIPHAHHRSVSETHGLDRYENRNPIVTYDGAYDKPPPPPIHTVGTVSQTPSSLTNMRGLPQTPDRLSSEDEQVARSTPVLELQDLQTPSIPEPVAAPPKFAHGPGSMPMSKPYHSPELRRANSRMSNGTLSQLAVAGGVASGFHSSGEPRSSEDQRRQNVGRYSEEHGQRGVLSDANTNEFSANEDRLNKGMEINSRFSFEQPSPARSVKPDTHTNYSRPPPQFSYNPSNILRTQESTEPFPSYESSSRPPTAPGHSSNPSVESTFSSSSQPYGLQTTQSVLRKPLPTQTTSLKSPASPDTTSSAGSLGSNVIDQAAFEMIGRDERHLTPLPEAQIQRQNSGLSSIYNDDTASTVSPDYASTKHSFDTRPSVEKPRAGVMKTVGDVQPESSLGRNTDSSFNVDFGPTFNYASEKLPARAHSPGPLQSYGRASPGPGMSDAHVARALDPLQRPDSSGKSKSPARKLVGSENTHFRNNSYDRTVAWQPGMAVSTNVPGTQSITPEQFVQQRAAVAATTPLYAHQRQQSSNSLGLQGLGRNTPTPPLVRNRSSELLVLGHSRNNSSDLLQRPGSRGALASLGPSGSGDLASTLSAREQEHVARMTGQPLVNMAQHSKAPIAQAGLVGAISEREKEKAQMKKGINSQAVEYAIAQRQQQALYQQQCDQMAAGYRAQEPGYGNMGQYPQQYPQQYPVRSQSQQPWVPPAANVYPPGYGVPSPGYSQGYTFPSPGYAVPDQGRQSPSQYPPRVQSQQQYFPPQSQAGQDRGNRGYQ